MITETKCSDHPDAPHGFDRNGSHSVGHYVCECYGWTPPASIQEELRSVPERSRTTLEAADRIDLDATHIDTLTKVVDKLQTERDEYRKCADDQAMAHKVERDGLMEQVAALQAKLSAAEARERQTRATLHKFMANQQQPLTVQEVEQILAQHNYEMHGDRARYIVRMTEQAHGVKP